LDVLGIRAISDATDVARLKHAAFVLREAGVDAQTVTALLVLDWAFRCPELTAQFLTESLAKDWTAYVPHDIIESFRRLGKQQGFRTFWKGPSRLNLAAFAEKISVDQLLFFGKFFLSSHRTRAGHLMQAVTDWPNLSVYLGFSMLRSVAAAMGVSIRDAGKIASEMSAHTSHLAELVGLDHLRKHLQTHFAFQACDGLLAFYLCETAKLLKQRGVLQDLKHYKNHRSKLIGDLTSDAARAFLTVLRDASPIRVESGQETLVQEALMPMWNPRHTTTDTVRRWSVVVATT
jgi:hypothetical protein